MDNFDLNIPESPRRRRNTIERKVRRHDTPDPTPTDPFEIDEPTIETISETSVRKNSSRRYKSERNANLANPTRKKDIQTTYNVDNGENSLNQSTGRMPVSHNRRIPSFLTPFLDRRLHVFAGIVILVLAVVMMIVLFSHLTHAADDQAQVLNQTVSQMADSSQRVKNSGGAFGAWLSHVLFTDALGLGAFVLSIYMIVIGGCLIARQRINFWAFTFKSMLLMVSVSVIAGLVTYTADSAVFWGGTHGHYINDFLFKTTGAVGTFAVSILLFAALCCVFYYPLRKFIKRASALLPPLTRPTYTDVTSDPNVTTNDESGKSHSQEPASNQHEMYADVSPKEVIAIDGPELSQSTETVGEQFEIGEETTKETSVRQPVSGFSIDDDDDLNDELPDAQSTDSISLTQCVSLSQPANIASDTATTKKVATDPTFKVQAAKPLDESMSEKTPVVEYGSIGSEYDHRKSLGSFVMPGVDLLIDYPRKSTIDMEEQQKNKDRIVKTLGDYKITVSSITATVGPTVTLYEIIPTEGVRISQIKRLEDDIAMALAAKGIRIIAPIPGKGTVGIEVPNADPQTVSMRSLLDSPKFKQSNKPLPVALGATISNEVFVTDLASMPHALVAGATGQGKSVGLNAIIASLIYKKHPTELKFVLIDPKMVEFSLYSKISRHYMAMMPGEDEAIITDTAKVLSVLNSLCVEMDQRYALLKDAGVRDVISYNKKFAERKLNPDQGHKYLPYIVVIVDEFSDLILLGGKEIEAPVIRITQKARAVGIHMIIATQRPSTNVLTGLIKANCPARIAFRVQQMVDSRCILDRPGADKLIGRGDMLYSASGAIERMQCAFISTEEVENIVDFIGNQSGDDTYILPDPILANAEAAQGTGSLSNPDIAATGGTIGLDPLFVDCARFTVQQGPTSNPSTSSLQRRFQIGYNRAGKIMDQMENAGIVSAPQGANRTRMLLVDMATLEDIISQAG